MPLKVTMYTAVGGVDRVVGSEVLATRPGVVAQRTVYFGRGREHLARAARTAPHLSTNDAMVSKVQGRIDYEDDAVIVTNLSATRTLGVREWGARSIATNEHEGRTWSSGRGVIDILDTSSYLVVGPVDPLEQGWVRRLVPAWDDTPGMADEARERLRPLLLCGCRQGDPEACRTTSHKKLEEELRVALAGGLPFAAWPQGREAAERSRKSIAALLDLKPYQLSRTATRLEERLGEGTSVPDQDEVGLFCWLVDRKVFSFDEVADLVARVS